MESSIYYLKVVLQSYTLYDKKGLVYPPGKVQEKLKTSEILLQRSAIFSKKVQFGPKSAK